LQTTGEKTHGTLPVGPDLRKQPQIAPAKMRQSRQNHQTAISPEIQAANPPKNDPEQNVAELLEDFLSH
jgi:hypothetical protein